MTINFPAALTFNIDGLENDVLRPVSDVLLIFLSVTVTVFCIQNMRKKKTNINCAGILQKDDTIYQKSKILFEETRTRVSPEFFFFFCILRTMTIKQCALNYFGSVMMELCDNMMVQIITFFNYWN